MSRTRIVQGKYIKISHGEHNMSAEGNIVSNASVEVRENGKDNGVIYGDFERKGSEVNEDFEITFSLRKGKEYSTVVPFGILDFDGKYENAYFVFDYSLTLSNIDSLKFVIVNEDGSILYSIENLPEVVVSAKKIPLLAENLIRETPVQDPIKPKKILDLNSIFNPYNIPPSDYTRIGNYVIFWDGFDGDDIYDSTKFNNKKLKAQIIAKKNGKEKIKEIEFTTEYSEVDWIDVKIDKNNKRVDATLRVNLTDGGEEGLDYQIIPASSTYPAIEYKPLYDWEKIPKESLILNKPPLKSRTRTFEDLKNLVISGLKEYWSRSKNRNFGNSINLNEIYEFVLFVKYSEINSLNSLPLIYNTNNAWMRSGNPGGSYKDGNLDDNALAILPDLGVIQRLSYNVGYIFEYHYFKTWEYQDSLAEDEEFKETAAHEIGHELLQAYGGTIYSWQHKGSSYYLPQDTKPTKGKASFFERISHWDEMKSNGEDYPLEGEIDIMKYYNKEPKVKDRERMVAAERDVLGLIWLTKLNIK